MIVRSYLVSTKLYPTDRNVGPYKCGGKRCEVCTNINEASAFTSTVTGKIQIRNHRLDCNERCLVYLLTYDKCKIQYVGKTIDQSVSRWNNYKSDSGIATSLQQHLFYHFCTSGHYSFLGDVSYWRKTLKTMTPIELNIKESLQQFYCQYFEHFHFYRAGRF